MRALLDSHTFLWAINDDPRLGQHAREVFVDAASDLFLSLASVWELSLKARAGRLEIPKPAATYLSSQAVINRVGLLQIALAHIQQTERLPLYHRDPFDRILVSQAIVEDFALITVDRELARYGVPVIW